MAEVGEHDVGNLVRITDLLVKNRLPSGAYKSTVGVYGGEIRRDKDGRMVYDVRILRKKIIRGISSGVDVIGDRMLRPYDDHVVQNPEAMFKRHQDQFWGFVFRPNAPRHRGTTNQILENVKRLGLTEYYGKHPWGIEIKKPEVFTKGMALQDIFRAKEINSPVLTDIDPLQALREATIYIKKIHDEYGPIGDLVGDIMFQNKEGRKVKNPVLNIPDVVLTPSTRINKSVETLSREQKATDILEHLFHAGFELLKQSKDAAYVKEALDTIIQAYGNKEVLSITKSFVKRGRPTLPGMEKPKGPLKHFFPLHNKVHLSADSSNAAQVRKLVIDALTNFI